MNYLNEVFIFIITINNDVLYLCGIKIQRNLWNSSYNLLFQNLSKERNFYIFSFAWIKPWYSSSECRWQNIIILTTRWTCSLKRLDLIFETISYCKFILSLTWKEIGSFNIWFKLIFKVIWKHNMSSGSMIDSMFHLLTLSNFKKDHNILNFSKNSNDWSYFRGDLVARELLNGNVLNQYYMNVNNCAKELHQYVSSDCPPVQYTPVKTLPFWVNALIDFL